jgi:hypothetical protein
MTPNRRPGEALIKRYMPNATTEEREAALTNLKDYLRTMIRIASRRESERKALSLHEVTKHLPDPQHHVEDPDRRRG